MSGEVRRRVAGATDPTIRVLDRALYALFSRHADRARHERDRRLYRSTDLRVSFDVFLARLYGLSVLAFVGTFVATLAVGIALPSTTVAAVATTLHEGLPFVDLLAIPVLPRLYGAAFAALLLAFVTKRATIAAGRRYLGWHARARRADIERTLPGAVRYLHALSAGSDDHRVMLRKVAANREAYGQSAVAFRKVLNRASLTGSLGEGLQLVARDTPSRDLLSPFLLKFREHAEQGPDELAAYLKMESRMLNHRQDRARERAEGFLELVAELFVVLLVLPALLVIVVTVLGVLAPGLGQPVTTPFGPVTKRALLVYGATAFILLVGAGAAVVVDGLRPAGLSGVSYRRPGGLATVASSLANPASAAVTLLPLGAAVAAGSWWLGYHPANVVLLGYVAYALPVGGIAVRRARRDDAKDREISDVIHAVSGHVSLGRPFGEAVELVARDVDLGPLAPDVADLAFTANLTSYSEPDPATTDGGRRAVDLRTAALERFVDRVGTPLAEQTMGLVTGALDVGSDADAVFETLQTEIGRLHHEKQALRSSLLVYVAVGWTAALLLIAIMVAVNLYVLDGFAQLGSVSNTGGGFTLAPDAIQPERDRYRFYVVTQATMLACGWFAGTASRGRYEALLHSAGLVLVAYFVYAGAGML